MIAVDTGVWIDWLNDRDTRHTAYLDSLIADDSAVALTDLVLAEVLQGVRTDALARQVDETLSAHEILRLDGLDDFRVAAELYRRCRRTGVTIRRASDCLSAGVCIREGVPLLHADGDFDHLAAHSDLEVIAPR